MKIINQQKLKNKTLVFCTDYDRKVKGLIVNKDDNTLVVDLPTGAQLILIKKPKGKYYICNIGMLEFVSDGWEIS